MTGMGKDGAYEMKQLKDAGATTIAQDQKSSVVFGMAMEACKHGAVDSLLPLSEIGPAINKVLGLETTG